MPIGFVLINTTPAHKKEVYDKLSEIEEIKDLHPLFEEYDFIAKIEAEKSEDLGKIIDKIRSIEGIEDTKTLLGTKF